MGLLDTFMKGIDNPGIIAAMSIYKTAVTKGGAYTRDAISKGYFSQPKEETNNEPPLEPQQPNVIDELLDLADGKMSSQDYTRYVYLVHHVENPLPEMEAKTAITTLTACAGRAKLDYDKFHDCIVKLPCFEKDLAVAYAMHMNYQQPDPAIEETLPQEEIQVPAVVVEPEKKEPERLEVNKNPTNKNQKEQPKKEKVKSKKTTARDQEQVVIQQPQQVPIQQQIPIPPNPYQVTGQDIVSRFLNPNQLSAGYTNPANVYGQMIQNAVQYPVVTAQPVYQQPMIPQQPFQQKDPTPYKADLDINQKCDLLHKYAKFIKGKHEIDSNGASLLLKTFESPFLKSHLKKFQSKCNPDYCNWKEIESGDPDVNFFRFVTESISGKNIILDLRIKSAENNALVLCYMED